MEKDEKEWRRDDRGREGGRIGEVGGRKKRRRCIEKNYMIYKIIK